MNRIGLGIMAVVLSGTSIPAAEKEGTLTRQEHVQVADLTPVQLHPVVEHAPVPIIAPDGRARAVIYVAEPDRTAKLDMLLAELVEAIRLSTGAQMQFVDTLPAPDQPAIIVGQSDETREQIDSDAIPVEGFRILTGPNRVYLIGSTMALPYPGERQGGKHHPYANDGTAWAVADFLERVVGVRWYWPVEAGGRSVRKTQSMVVPPTHYADAPVFQMRTHHPPFSYRSPWKSRWFDKGYVPVEFQASEAAAAAARQDEQEHPRLPLPKGLKELDMRPLLAFLRSGNSWPFQIRVHEPQSYWRRGEEWMAANQALLAVGKDGKPNRRVLCYSSPATLAFLLEGCEQVWDHGGNASWVTPHTVTVSPADVAVTCHCQDCQALWIPGDWRGTAAKIMADFLQKFATEVQRRWPDKKVVYLPYWNYTLLPEGYDFPDNLEVMVANNFPQGPAEFRLDQVRHDAVALLRRWATMTGSGRVTTWEYSLSVTGWTHAPVQFPHVIRDFYSDNRELLAGSFLNGGNVAEWSRCAPTLYCWMKVLWNPELDVEKVLDEMCRRMFGEGSEPARRLLGLMVERFEQAEWPERMGGAGRVSDPIFNAIWPAEIMADMQALRQAAEARFAPGSVERQRLDYWLWTFDAFIEEARQRNEPKNANGED